MTNGFNTQGLQNLLAFPFRAPNARMKLALLAVLSFAGFIVPVLPGVFLLGYGGFIMRRIIQEDGEPSLPDWDNWNEMLVLGLRLGGALLIYGLPVVLVALLSYFGMIIPFILDAFSTANGSATTGSAMALQFGGMFVWMAGFGVAMLLGTVVWLILPVVMGHVVATNSFSAAFHVRDWWRILRANLGGYIVSMVLIAGIYMGVILVAQILYMTIVLCVLFPVAITLLGAYLLVISNVVFGQAYAEAAARLEMQPTTPPAPAEPAGT
jgi:hypothetical protein